MDKSKIGDKKELRKFGIGLAIILFAIGTIQYYFGKGIYWYFYNFSIIALFLALVIPKALKPVFILFSYIGLTINWFITRIILGIAFYILFTPFGVIMRLLGKDFLDLKLEEGKESFWSERKIKKLEKDDFEKQF